MNGPVHVPFLDLKAQYRSIKTEIDAAIQAVLDETAFVGGKALKSFESAFAAAQNVRHCIGVANGTDALFATLKALGVRPGDTVITQANSFIASSEAITLAGARPLFVDCSDDYTMDVVALERALVEGRSAGLSIRAVIPVHLYGRACNMTRIVSLARAHESLVIEDCAQAHLAEHAGKKVGTFGDVATFSFYPGKNLGAYGDGGAVVTNDDAHAERIRMFANHGRKDKYDHVFEGMNSRLDNLQAAILGVKLRHLSAWTSARIAAASRYRERLANVVAVRLPLPAAGLEHVYHLFVVRVENRESVRARLKEFGVETGVHYPSALPNLPAYRHLGVPRDANPKASAFESGILSLPMFAEIAESQIDHVVDSLRRATS